MKILRTAGLISFLAGCAATPPTPQELASANYGPAPKNYKASVITYMSGILKDPDSARYGFYGEPVKWYAGRDRKFGWATCAAINAKNSFGGYVGARQYFFLIREEVVVYHNNTEGRSILYDNDIIAECNKLHRR